MFERDLVEAGEDAATEAGAAVGGRDVHALHLGDFGVEVADTAETGRLQGEVHKDDASALQNFSILRATCTESPGRIALVNRRELSEAVAEAAARTEAAAALTREAAARTEAAVALQQEARARQEVATAKLEEIQVKATERNEKLDDLLAKADALLREMRADRAQAQADREDEKIWREEFLRRQEKMFQDHLHRADERLAETKQQTVEIIAELQDHRDERRAFKEALLKLIDRLPPQPPHLRSA